MSSVLRRSQGQREDLAALLKSLVVGVGRFAKWRWKTLGRAVRDMQRIEVAVFLAIEVTLSACKPRDGASGAALLVFVQDDETWSGARAIDYIIRHFIKMSGWMQGCFCHEEQLLLGK